MKIQKKIFAGGCALLIACGTLVSVSASSVTSGIYQTVRHNNIPGGGEIHYDTAYGSKKTDSGSYATFKETYKEAALGNFAMLISKSKAPKSSCDGLILNTAVLARESGVSKGTVYYSAVASHKYEPSNSCDVIIKFSADNLK